MRHLTHSFRSRIGRVFALTAAIGLVATISGAQVCPPNEEPVPEPVPNPPLIGPLTAMKPPLPAALLTDIIKDKAKAIVLGKALFWDEQVGSHGIACASCHFQAGADTRNRNQLNSGVAMEPPDSTFQYTKTGIGGVNYQMKLEDFPFHVLADPTDRNSPVLFDTNDVMGAAGVYAGTYVAPLYNGDETCTDTPPANTLFQKNGYLVRQSTGRNAPTVINAAFQFRTFWDGRANNHFNGVNPFGRRDPNAKVLQVQPNGTVAPVVLDLENAALASQAVGPPTNDVEMTCKGKTWKLLGRKMLGKIAYVLFKRVVDQTDSVLGPYANIPPKTGLNPMWTYPRLIREAFQDKWWNAPSTYRTADGFKMMEANFSMYFGIAVMLYESTLISDQTPFDAYVNGNYAALNESQLRGLGIFMGKGKCSACHVGPDFTSAGIKTQREVREGGLVERMLMGDDKKAMYDSAFYNLGVRPTVEDRGVGNNDPFGNPLSFTKQFVNSLAGINPKDPFQVNTCSFDLDACVPKTALSPNDRIAVDGAFKVSSLRNVELTGPYFHNGAFATLEQVVDFYNRGGDARDTGPDADTSGFGINKSNRDVDITRLELTTEEKADLVQFLLALTDERVRCESAPFDHPGLEVRNGHKEPAGYTGTKLPDYDTPLLPAVGAGGRKAKGLACLKSFASALPTTGAAPKPTY